jgi:ribonuclease P protein component
VDKPPQAQWLGCMVPKRQARRAVTRNLVKRQMRESFRRHAAALPMGLWLLRLHAGFPVADYPSAASAALAEAVRGELDRLLAGASHAR